MTGTPSGWVGTERHAEIAVVTLRRPPANAMNLALLEALGDALGQLSQDESVHGLVLTGSGRCFSAGMDLREVPACTPAEQRQLLDCFNDTMAALYALPLPTAAAVNGHAIAGGLILALACDVRIAGSECGALGLTEARIGIPLPVAALEIVRTELGEGLARRWLLTAETSTAAQACALGVVDEVVAASVLPQVALDRVRALAALPRVGYGRIKQQLRAPTLTRMRAGIASGDPLRSDWITAEAVAAATATLRGSQPR